MHTLSATQRALSIPELLSTIFRFSRRQQNASNLVVCKLWAQEVLGVEWEVVDNAQFQLFHLLAPVTEATKGIYSFARELTPEDWTVFNRYAYRVKAFSLSGDAFLSIQDVVNAIGSHRRLLPNLKSLSCAFDANIIRLFAHPEITSLTLHPGSEEKYHDDEDVQSARSTLDLISKGEVKFMHLRRLAFEAIYLDGPFSIVEPSLITFLTPLRNLRSLTLMPAWLSEEVTHAISLLPHLVKLVTNDAETCIDDPSSTFSDKLKCDSFSALRHLAISCRFDRAFMCFSSGVDSFARLDTLALKSDVIEPPESVKRILTLVARNFPCLTGLGIDSNTFSSGMGPFDWSLSLNDLKPILDLRHLKFLSITYPHPLQLTSQDLKTITETLKDLSTLYLNPSPSRKGSTTLHISALSALFTPTSSPEYNLRQVSLYVDTSPANFPKVDELLTLTRLEYLSVGCSPMAKEAVTPTSVYLSRVLPKLFKRRPRSLWRTIGPDENSTLWKEVFSLIRVLMHALHTGQRRALLSQKGLFVME